MDTKEKQGYSLEELEELLSDALPVCFNICKLLLEEEKTAMFVAADAYKRVLKSPEKIPSKENFHHWIKNVVTVACSSYLKRWDEGVFLTNTHKSQVDKLEIFHNKNLNVTATAKYLQNRIERMPSAVRFATICYYYNGMTVNQIATVLSVPVIRVKELMRLAASEISALTREFNDKSVTATKLDIAALLDVCAAEGNYPHLDLSSLVDKSSVPEVKEETSQKSEKKLRKNFLVAAEVLLLAVGVGVYVVNSLFGVQPEPHSQVSSVDSVFLTEEAELSSEVEAIVESELAEVVSTPEVVVPVAPAPLYDITHEICYDVGGDKIREAVYTYKDGILTRTQTATQMFLEDLKYQWNKNGTKRTTTDGEGEIREVAWYDRQGNPTKLKYGDRPEQTVKYKWTYKLDDKGRVISAKFKGINSGEYTYQYDEEGRKIKETETREGDKFSTVYTYDDSGMVITKVETDFDGTITETFYTYDYQNLTFTAVNSRGEKTEGRIAAKQQSE